jgi:UPF0755 protein
MIRPIYFKPIVIGSAILVVVLIYWLTISSPRKYPIRSIITVREGAGLLEVASTLEKTNVIRSPFWFRTVAIALGGERGLKAGDYYLPQRENVLRIAWRIVRGKKDIETLKLTIPEGFTIDQIAALFDSRFPKFDQDDFYSRAKEGYLFPDTYFVEVSATASSTINLLENNFNVKIAPFKDEIASSTRTFDDLINMASILEEEAVTTEDRHIIAGILWKRIDLGMPLQVDATLKYVTGRGTAELTQEDLKLDSPYNSYTNKDLPPTPISNPGIDAILAAVRPQKSPYLYFLNDKDGIMHYSKTFEEHKRNKTKYLSD